MTADFESMTELLLVVLTVACLAQVVFAGLLLWYMKRVAETLGSMRAPVSTPEAPPHPVPVPGTVESTGATGRGRAAGPWRNRRLRSQQWRSSVTAPISRGVSRSSARSTI